MPIVRNHLAVVELTPRSKCVYTRHPDLCHATSGVLTSQPPEHAQIGMHVKTLSDRQHKKKLRVNTASGANWLKGGAILSNYPVATLCRTCKFELISQTDWLSHAHVCSYSLDRNWWIADLSPVVTFLPYRRNSFTWRIEYVETITSLDRHHLWTSECNKTVLAAVTSVLCSVRIQ